jgi:hypothetical protein
LGPDAEAHILFTLKKLYGEVDAMREFRTALIRPYELYHNPPRHQLKRGALDMSEQFDLSLSTHKSGPFVRTLTIICDASGLDFDPMKLAREGLDK